MLMAPAPRRAVRLFHALLVLLACCATYNTLINVAALLILRGLRRVSVIHLQKIFSRLDASAFYFFAFDMP